MKQHHLSDTTCILALSGLKYVSKDDTRFPGTEFYYLNCAYKGHVTRIVYTTKDARDAMFDRLAVALDEQAKPPKEDA